jgi:predicted TIM-barrel fold metal-dependent hydrolase
VTIPERLVSSDTHVIEPPDLWTTRIAPEYADRAPHTQLEGAEEWWYVEGLRTNSFAGGVQAGVRFEDASQLRSAATFAEVRPGGYDPAAHLVDNLTDGVLASVLYPTEGLLLYGVPDSGLLNAICVAYNDWITEFCRHDPRRLCAVAMLNVDDPAWAADELDRAADAGARGAMIPVSLPVGQFYDDANFEVLWARAATRGIPLSLHLGTVRAAPDGSGGFTNDLRSVRASAIVNQDYWLRNSLTDLILGGVFERHPELKVGAIEHELGWAPYFVESMDFCYAQRARRKGWHRFADPAALPSDYFRRNIFASFQADAVGIELRRFFGNWSLMWGSDYPHSESTFPRSRQVLAGLLSDVSAADRRRILVDNVVDLYQFDLSDALTPSGANDAAAS